MSNNDASDPDFTIPLPLPPPTPSNAIIPISPNPNLQVALSPRYEQSPKKKRTKTIASSSASSSNPSLKPKPKPTKKPDPNAPNITRPCTECGKKFWSWKALFGHMRCHPERQWRGINPPPDHQQHRIPKRQRSPNWSSMSETDHQVASYLVLLANTTPTTPPPSSSSNSERFECGVCKKVFGSHQALGGHRASHKNVKGCFAITNVTDDLTTVATTSCSDHQDHQGKIVSISGNHKCNICSRVFPSGQALGGHMRCHWEKGEETPIIGSSSGALDLNLPAIQEEPSTSDTAECSLDLRLGL